MTAAESIELSELVKERHFEENPRRHFMEKEQAMHEKLVAQLFAKGFLKKTLTPTDKPGEYLMTMSIRALKPDA